MLAGVDDGVRSPDVVEPAVEAQVVVGRRQVGGVVDGGGSFAEAPGRLDGHEDPAQIQPGEDQVPRFVDVDPARRRSPLGLHLGPHRSVHLGPPVPVELGGEAPGGGRHLRRGQGGVLVGEGLDQLRHQGVAASRNAVDPVPGAGQRPQQGDDGRRGVERHGVADPAAGGRIGGQHDGHPPLGGRDRPQPAQADRQPGDAGHPVGHGPIGVHRRTQGVAVVDLLVERERHPHDATVELRQRHAHGDVQGKESSRGGLPLLPGGGGGDGLQHRDVQGAQGRRIPAPAVVGCAA